MKSEKDIEAYYSLTNIPWADSPSPYALEDLASNGGNVYDYTWHIKSIILGEKIGKTAKTFYLSRIVALKFSCPLSFALTEKIAKKASIDESNPYLILI